MESEREKQIVRYLLGRLSQEQQAELESAFMSDDAVFEELLVVENELRDAYDRGELSGADRRDFEQRLLRTPRQRKAQQFTQALRQPRTPSTPAARIAVEQRRWKLLSQFGLRPRIFVPALSLALLVLVVAGVWLVRWESARPVPNQTASDQGVKTETPPAPQEPSPTEEKTIALVLTSDLVRGGGAGLPSLVIPAGVSVVRLEAPVKRNFPRYAAALQTVEGRNVWSGDRLTSHPGSTGETVMVLVPSAVLTSGDYILSIRGVRASAHAETVGDYSFRIRKP